VSCENGILHVDERDLLAHSPKFMNLVAAPYAYDPDATAPEWEKFLHSVWPDDQEQTDLLQEWFGYIVSGRTDLHKMMLFIGPKRAGKGTVGRVLTNLIGGDVASQSLDLLGSRFGLQSVADKPLWIIGDNRADAPAIAVERLLGITGEDEITVEAKYQAAASQRLPTRIMMLSNELPRLGDRSAVVASRFVILQAVRSWADDPDVGLGDRLEREMSGILNWALAGLSRLESRGRFTEPEATGDVRRDLEESASPYLAFIRSRCVVGPEYEVVTAIWYAAWKAYAIEHGHKPGSDKTFLRAMKTLVDVEQVRLPAPSPGGKRPMGYRGVALLSLGEF
jgi:putative DNA primase/helicase